ncbi:MAG: hypothetical protein ACRDV0_02370, partial [Acidimicrobiales bacterium]
GALVATGGFVAYMLYLGVHTGIYRAWFQEEWHGFDHHLSLYAPIHWLHKWPAIGLTETLSLAVFAAGVYALWRIRAPVEWSVYSLLLVASVVFDTALWANPRFLFNAFPLVLAIGVWLRRDAYRVALATSAALLPLLFLLYMTMGTVMFQP